MSPRLRSALPFVCVAFLLVVGGALRLQNVNWDQFQHVHPDERFIVWVADTVSLPGDLRAALDPEWSPLNPFRWPSADGKLPGQPRAYAYGHFPLYLLVGAAHLGRSLADWMGGTTVALPAFLQPFQVVGRHLTEYEFLPLVGRTISALCDLVTLLVIFGLGSRAFGRAAGLIAAGSYAIAVLPIQLSHFYAVDLVLTLWVVATVALAARWADQGGWVPWLLAGVTAGLAVGSKFSAVMVAAPLVVAAVLRPSRGGSSPKLVTVVGRLAAVGAMGLLVFGLTNPFALIEARAYLANIVSQQVMVSGAADLPYTRQYIGSLPYLYFIGQLGQWGLGWPLGLLAWSGPIWLTVRAFRKNVTPPQLVILAWVLPYLIVTGAFHTKFLRYMAPALPFLLICGAGALMAGYLWSAGRWGSRGRLGFGVLVTAAALLTVGWTLSFTSIYRHEHTWISASRWIYENVPTGSKLLSEHWDDALPLRMDEISDRPSAREYERVELPLYDPDTSQKLEALVSELSSADFLVIASNRLYGPIGRLPGRYPMTAQYYRLLFDGGLGYHQVAEFASYPTLAGVSVRDDGADESFTVYDHPRVMIFRNVERLKPGLLRARLERYLPSSRLESMLRESFELGWARRSEVRLAPVADGRARGRPPGRARELPPAESSAQGVSPKNDRPLTLAQPVGSLPVVADFRWNRFASEWPPAAILAWWLMVSLFGWLSWPLLYPVMGGLRDRGYGLARAAGWLLVGWTHWIGVSLGLWQNRTWIIAVILACFGAASVVAWRRQHREIAELWLRCRTLILVEEAVFSVAFLAFVAIRILNPDLWQPWNGGEKFMESAFINAILRSPSFPPYDPYFAGGYINYYYYGLYLVSLPIKLTGIASEVAFNLAVPSLAALSAVGLVSVGASLAWGGGRGERDVRGGAAGAIFGAALAMLVGNLAGLKAAVRSFDSLGKRLSEVGRFLSGSSYDYWAPSRVIPYTINEFPFWTFLFADLHPHLIAIPFGVLVVGLVFNWLKTEDSPSLGVGPVSGLCLGRVAARLLLLALALGALGAINTWDLPSYGLLVFSVLLLAGWREARARSMVSGMLAALLTGVLALAAYWPFYHGYQSPVALSGGPLLTRYLGWTRQGSPLGEWLLVWGIFLFLAYSFAMWEFLHDSANPRTEGEGALSGHGSGAASKLRSGRAQVGALLLVLALAAFLATLQRPAAALAAVPLVLLIMVALRRRLAAEEAFLNVLAALGLGILAGLELVYVRDFLDGGDWYRMNTVFKFSMPAWLFLGLSLGVMLGKRWQRRDRTDPAAAPRPSEVVRGVWMVAVCVLLLAGCAFLVFGVQARLRDRFPGRRPFLGTLDGTAYMTVGEYTWPDASHLVELAYEYQAIHWMLDHLKGSPVVAEAPAGGYSVADQFQAYDYYRAGGLRVASLTGFPTFIGQHQSEQRSSEQVGPRTELGQEFYRTADVERTKELLRQLEVDYIYVGALERILFPQASLGKFDAMAESGELSVAYRNPQVILFRVNASAP